MIRTFLLYITAVFCCTYTCAQQAPDFIFKHLSISEGLASNFATCTLQDKRGLWWIGTDNGLQRWDGYRFVTYHAQATNNNSLWNDEIQKLLEDRAGNIWIAHLQGVTLYNRTKNSFTRISLDKTLEPTPYAAGIFSFFQTQDGTIWITGNNMGLQFYDATAGSFVSYTRKMPAFHMRFLYAAQQQSTGNFWMGTDSGLVCYNVKDHQYYYKNNNPKKLTVFQAPFLQFPFTCFYIDSKEQLWLCNWPTITPVFQPTYYTYNIPRDSVTYYPNALINNPQSVTEDQYGRIWLAGSTLHFYDSSIKSFAYIKKQQSSKIGMDYDALFQVNCDNDGNIWLATDNGVFVFEPAPKPINTYRTDTSLVKEPDPDMAVTSFLEYDANNIWVVSWGRGAFLYDSLMRVKKRIFSVGKRNLFMGWCVARGRNNVVWFGWQEGVLLSHDVNTQKENYYQPEELRKKTIRQIAYDNSDNLWIGTQRGILAYYNTPKNKFERIWDGVADGQSNGNIQIMKMDAKQHLWIGTSHNGLLEFDATTKELLRHFKKEAAVNKLHVSNVADICFLNDTTLLVVGQGGIDILNTHTGKVMLFEYPALRTNNIRAVEKGSNGDVYFAGPNGIFRINLVQMKLHIYGEQDGLLFNAFAEGSHILLSDGRICFGTDRNFVTLKEEGGKAIKAKALVSGIRIMNQPISVDSLESLNSPVELTYDHNYVAIDFAAPAMVLQPNNTFLYKMEGFDREWKIAAQYPSAEYSNLPPGKYRFLLKYRNTDGQESSNATIIPFIIHPPFYLRWWFITIAIGLVGAVIYLLHRIRVNKLVTMEKVRIHIARDLHDDMGSTLSSINILSLMSSKTVEKEPAKTKEYLARIGTYSQRMMDSMDDIVWSINPLNDDMARVVARMREVAATCLEPKDIEYRFYIDETVNHLKLEMSKRRDLFLIYKEAINNMAKYSECTKAVIHVTAKKGRLIMHIEDNGCGFDETIMNDGNGLINMRKRAEGLKGRFTIHSSIGNGTELTLNIPA